MPQGEERLVDLHGFFEGLGVYCLAALGLGLPLAACEIHELELAHYLRVLSLAILLKDVKGKKAVRAAGGVVHVVGGHNFVF